MLSNPLGVWPISNVLVNHGEHASLCFLVCVCVCVYMCVYADVCVLLSVLYALTLAIVLTETTIPSHSRA